MTLAPPIRVLVVDDSEDVRFLIGLLLQDEPDVEVVASVADADAALAVLAEAAPDVVLMDARMPRVDGFELTAQVLAARPGARVVLLTSHVDEDVRARAARAGAIACASKGDWDALGDLVRDALAR